MRSILFVHGTSEIGGSDVALLRLVRGLAGKWQIIIVLPGPGPLVAAFREAGARVVIFPMMQLRSVRDVRYQLRFVLGFWPTVLRLARVIRHERADIVHTNSLFMLYGGWAAFFARTPHVWHVREIPQLPPLLTRLLMTMAYMLSSKVVVMSRAIAALLPGHASRLVVVYDGIDTAVFHPGRGVDTRAELGAEPGEILVGFAGRLDPWKGVDVFIRAAALVAPKFPSARFAVIGGELRGYEPYRQSLEDLAQTSGLSNRLLFTGWKFGPDRMPEVMSALDILVLSSTAPEPFGLVLIEAMAAGTAVIATAAGGPLEIIDDGESGLLVTPGSVEETAAAIGRLIEDPGLCALLSTAGRSRVTTRFTTERTVAEMSSLYESIGSVAAKR